MAQSVNANRKYKSSVFASYFSDGKKLIEAYNAIEGKNYPMDSEVLINTLEDALFMERINDISFLLAGKLIVLIEHQASLSENFPLRMLLYVSRLYEKILTRDNIYRQKLIKIPKPDFIVLYNGDREYPDHGEVRLSDAFKDADIPILLELTVHVYNINQGRSQKILQKSKSLGDYAAFIGRIKENNAKGLSTGEAIGEAVDYCIDNGIMKEYLQSNASEVRNMLFTEWNMNDAKRVWQEEAREEAWDEAWDEAWEKAAESIAARMLLKGDAPEIVAECAGIPLENVLRLSESQRAMKN